MAVMQLWKIIQRAKFMATPKSDERFALNHSRTLGSLVTEEAFGALKNRKSVQNRRGTIQESFKTLRDSNVLSERHRFDEVDLVDATSARGDRVDPDVQSQ